MKSLRYAFLTFLLLTPSLADALSVSVKQLVENETKGNAVAARSDEMVAMENYEIPLSALTPDLADRIPADVRDSLIFEKNGEKYVRWVINPEDTKWYKELEKFLTEKGLSTERHKYFQAYQTASRSYIVEDPASHAQFSLKVSTNVTGGNWRDKQQTAEDAGDVRRATDFVMEEGQKKPFKNFTVMDEPAAFRINEIDQGMLVRTLADLPKADHYYLPGFSAVNDSVGRAIAAKNGSLDPAAFWNQHYNKRLAHALAELAARTGIAYDSPHSQNFLVELDNDLKPTGQIILRDLGDIYINPAITEAKGGATLVKSWPAENVTRNTLQASVGTLHGNQYPSWMNDQTYAKWGDDFFREYNKELSKQTGIALKDLPSQVIQSGRYFKIVYDTEKPEWKAYVKSLKAPTVKRAPAARVSSTASPCERDFSAPLDGVLPP